MSWSSMEGGRDKCVIVKHGGREEQVCHSQAWREGGTSVSWSSMEGGRDKCVIVKHGGREGQVWHSQA